LLSWSNWLSRRTSPVRGIQQPAPNGRISHDWAVQPCCRPCTDSLRG
jgi:hypothetical protein